MPGPTKTEGVMVFFEILAKEQGVSVDDFIEEFFASARPSSLLKRLIDPKEVASTVAFLCSPMAAATNGAAVRVDGGLIRSVV